MKYLIIAALIILAGIKVSVIHDCGADERCQLMTEAAAR